MSALLKLLGERDYDNDDTRFTVVLPWREWRNTKNDLAELASLRESVATLTAQNAEQARQLSEARHAISESSDALDGAGLGGCYASQACRAWLAANAPAPQENDENQPALLTPNGYFTDWPEDDAPQDAQP